MSEVKISLDDEWIVDDTTGAVTGIKRNVNQSRSELAKSTLATVQANQLTGMVKNPRLGGVVKMLEKYGVVANGTTDDASALQECIDAARYEWGGAFPIPAEISAIKINSGLTLHADTDRFICDRPILLDCSGMTSGNALNIDCGVTDGNAAPLYNILNFMSGIRMLGGAAAGVKAMRFYGASGRPYFYQVKNVTADNFETTVDLSGNSFGIAFEDVAFRSATGGTLIQCLTGAGSNYGERYNFTRAMLYNSGRALLNTNAATTFRFINSSFDYNDVMADVQAGRVSLESCHIETQYDADYLFKVSGNEAAALTLDKCEFVLNGINRTKELFDIDSNVKFGGIFVRDSMISMGAGYSAHTIVRGTGRAIAQNLMTFVANNKPAFSRFMNKIRAGLDDANALAEWTLTGTTPPAISATSPNEGAGSLYFAPQTGVCQAEIIVPIEPGQHPRFSYMYKKENSTTGQGKLQTTLAWLDSKGTVIGSTTTVDDLDGNVGWTMRKSNINAPAPIGARSYRFRILKSADAGAVGSVYVDDLVINNI